MGASLYLRCIYSGDPLSARLYLSAGRWILTIQPGHPEPTWESSVTAQGVVFLPALPGQPAPKMV
jgi:hypothetical protein